MRLALSYDKPALALGLSSHPMPNMPFVELTLEIGSADPAPYEDAVAELGAVSVTLEDAADDPVLEPGPGETPLWPTVRLRALFEGHTDPVQTGNAIARRFPRLPPARSKTVEDKAWEREWLKGFRPMRFGRRLWVCPGGQPAGDSDAIRIELDPGLAFGTGTHPTTAMCLEWLEGRDLCGRRAVDYGCGSGILAIAALKLGAASVLAVDIDPQALIATRENARRNDVQAGLSVTSDASLEPQSTDVLVANILAGPILELAPRFALAVGPGGEMALSGLLNLQVDAVTSAYQPWFDMSLTATREGWGLVSGRRRAG